MYFVGVGLKKVYKALIRLASTLATSCEQLTHWKRLWCWEGLGAGGERDDQGWGGWMASRTQWTWVWVNSGSWWWTGRPGVLRFMGLQRVGDDWATELNWTELLLFISIMSKVQYHGKNHHWGLAWSSHRPIVRVPLLQTQAVYYKWALLPYSKLFS